MKESYLEQKCCRWAKQEYGIDAFKLQGLGAGGRSDRILVKSGHCIFVEFKKPGEKLRPLQEHFMNIMNQKDNPAVWCDNFETFKTIIEEWVHAGIA